MRYSAVVRIGLLSIASVPAFGQSTTTQSVAGEIFSNIVEGWEDQKFWYIRPALPDQYVPGKRVNMLIFWNDEGAAYCSCELGECREFLRSRRVKIVEKDQHDLPQPCDLYGFSIWYLIERIQYTEPEVRKPPVVTPPTSSEVEIQSPPMTGSVADELARMGISLAREIALGKQNLYTILAAECDQATEKTAREELCVAVEEIHRNVKGELFTTVLPTLEAPRAIRERTVPTAADKLVSLLTDSVGKDVKGECAPPELVLPFFDDSDNDVCALYRSSDCGETILIFGQSDEGEWSVEGALESPPVQEFYKKKIQNSAMVRVRIGERAGE